MNNFDIGTIPHKKRINVQVDNCLLYLLENKISQDLKYPLDDLYRYFKSLKRSHTKKGEPPYLYDIFNVPNNGKVDLLDELSEMANDLLNKIKCGDNSLVDVFRLCNYIELPCEIIGQVLTEKELPDDMFSNQRIFSRCTFFDMLGKRVEPLAEFREEEMKKTEEEYGHIIENSNVQFIYKPLVDIVFYQYDTITQSSVIDFCDKIMTKGDLAGISWQYVNGERRKYWMSYLKTRITVKLVEGKDMPEPNIPKSYKPKDIETRKDTEVIKDTEWLGCYCSDTMEILLCPERIKNASNNLYNKLRPEDKTNISQDYCEQVIFAMVLIHEFAHAILDPTNLADRTIRKPVFDFNINEDLRFFLEESLANMIMLKYFDASFGKESKEFLLVEKFVDSQSYAYSFGLKMYDAKDVDWSLWRDRKTILSQKLNQQQCLTDLKNAGNNLKNVYEQLFLYGSNE